MNWPDTRLCDLLNIEHPIIQAPMAGASSPEMAAAAANAGALGSLGCALQTLDQVSADADAVRAGTNRSVNFNFFVHAKPQDDADRTAAAIKRLEPWYDMLGLGAPTPPSETHPTFNADICALVLNHRPQVVSFHFGLPDAVMVAQLKDAGCTILSSATSAAEAIWLEQNGADAIIAQGFEAGGHNGWFLPRNGADIAGTFALVPRIVDAVSVPVIAAGGIADGRGIAAALTLGASGVQIGTAFLATPECRSHDVHKQAVINATGDDTMHTTAFSGRAARTITNDYVRDMAGVTDWPDFPMMNAATAPIRSATAKDGTGAAFALWAGQAVGLARAETTTQVVDRLVAQAKAILEPQ
ncbi:MAG: nitronate monooxygenase [Amylibacter sp.]|jgi:nitronate monooxygenase|nr:nitronate monooxygenase [Amylibacter sp.]